MDPQVAVAYANIPLFSALIFWGFITIVCVAGMFKEFANKREVQRTLRTAIEKGQPLDAAAVSAIMAGSGARPETLAVAGVIVIAAGLGLLMLGYFIGKLAAVAFYPIAGSGALALAVGLGLHLLARAAQSPEDDAFVAAVEQRIKRARLMKRLVVTGVVLAVVASTALMAPTLLELSMLLAQGAAVATHGATSVLLSPLGALLALLAGVAYAAARRR